MRFLALSWPLGSVRYRHVSGLSLHFFVCSQLQSRTSVLRQESWRFSQRNLQLPPIFSDLCHILNTTLPHCCTFARTFCRLIISGIIHLRRKVLKPSRRRIVLQTTLLVLLACRSMSKIVIRLGAVALLLGIAIVGVFVHDHPVSLAVDVFAGGASLG